MIACLLSEVIRKDLGSDHRPRLAWLAFRERRRLTLPPPPAPSSIQRQISRLDDRIRAHAHSQSLPAHDGEGDYEPQGFQANEQPRSLMSSNR